MLPLVPDQWKYILAGKKGGKHVWGHNSVTVGRIVMERKREGRSGQGLQNWYTFWSAKMQDSCRYCDIKVTKVTLYISLTVGLNAIMIKPCTYNELVIKMSTVKFCACISTYGDTAPNWNLYYRLYKEFSNGRPDLNIRPRVSNKSLFYSVWQGLSGNIIKSAMSDHLRRSRSSRSFNDLSWLCTAKTGSGS